MHNAKPNLIHNNYPYNVNLLRFAELSYHAKAILDQNPPSPVGFKDILSEDEFSILVSAINSESFIPSSQQALPFLKASLVWSIDSFQDLAQTVLVQTNDLLLNMQALALSIDATTIFSKIESSIANNIEKYVTLPSFINLPLNVIYRIFSWYFVQIPSIPSIIKFILSLFQIHNQAATPIFALFDISVFSIHDLYDLLSHNYLDMDLVGPMVQARVLQFQNESKTSEQLVDNSQNDISNSTKVTLTNQLDSAYKNRKIAKSKFNKSKAKFERMTIETGNYDKQISLLTSELESSKQKIEALKNENESLASNISSLNQLIHQKELNKTAKNNQKSNNISPKKGKNSDKIPTNYQPNSTKQNVKSYENNNSNSNNRNNYNNKNINNTNNNKINNNNINNNNINNNNNNNNKINNNNNNKNNNNNNKNNNKNNNNNNKNNNNNNYNNSSNNNKINNDNINNNNINNNNINNNNINNNNINNNNININNINNDNINNNINIEEEDEDIPVMEPPKIKEPAKIIAKTEQRENWNFEAVLKDLSKAKTYPSLIPSSIFIKFSESEPENKIAFFDYVWRGVENEDKESCSAYGSYLAGLDDTSNDLAVCLLKLAAEKGELDAQYNLAVMILNERGINKDINTASDLLLKAANAGHEASIIYLKSIHI